MLRFKPQNKRTTETSDRKHICRKISISGLNGKNVNSKISSGAVLTAICI